VTWGAAAGEAGLRWRADPASAANGGQAVEEELQPRSKSSGEDKGAATLMGGGLQGKVLGCGGRASTDLHSMRVRVHFPAIQMERSRLECWGIA